MQSYQLHDVASGIMRVPVAQSSMQVTMPSTASSKSWHGLLSNMRGTFRVHEVHATALTTIAQLSVDRACKAVCHIAADLSGGGAFPVIFLISSGL